MASSARMRIPANQQRVGAASKAFVVGRNGATLEPYLPPAERLAIHVSTVPWARLQPGGGCARPGTLARGSRYVERLAVDRLRGFYGLTGLQEVIAQYSFGNVFLPFGSSTLAYISDPPPRPPATTAASDPKDQTLPCIPSFGFQELRQISCGVRANGPGG
jgi:hypothetical protein